MQNLLTGLGMARILYGTCSTLLCPITHFSCFSDEERMYSVLWQCYNLQHLIIFSFQSGRKMSRVIFLSVFLFLGLSSSSDNGQMTGCIVTDMEGRDFSVLTVGSEIFNSSILRSALCISLHRPEWVSALHLHRKWWSVWRGVVRHRDRWGTFRHWMGSLQSGMSGYWWQRGDRWDRSRRRWDKCKYQKI